MKITYTASFHNGGRKKSKNGNDIKNPWQACREHNIRDPKYVKKQKHIKQDGIEGTDYEIWNDMTWEDAYREIFSEAIKKYNAKQKRSDRKIKDSNEYLERIKQHKTKVPVYESIVTIGNARINPENPEVVKKIYREFVENWEKRYPNLKIIGVYYHADESREKGIKYDNEDGRINGAPHIHIDWIPVETNRQEAFDKGNRLDENGRKTKYLRGMDVENSLTGAFAQMNIFAQKLSPKAAAKKGLHRREKKFKDPEKQELYENFLASRDTDTREYYPVMLWENEQRETLKKICRKHGLTIKNPNEQREHLDTDEYTREQSARETIGFSRQLALDLESEKSILEKNNAELEEKILEYSEASSRNQAWELELMELEKEQKEKDKKTAEEIKRNEKLLEAIALEKEVLSELKNDTNLQMQKAREEVEKEIQSQLDSVKEKISEADKRKAEAEKNKEEADKYLMSAEMKDKEAQEKLTGAKEYLENERLKVQAEEREKMGVELEEERKRLSDEMQKSISAKENALENEYTQKNSDLEQSYSEKLSELEKSRCKEETERKIKNEELKSRETALKEREKNFWDNVWKRFENAVIPDAEDTEIKLPEPNEKSTPWGIYNSARVVIAKLRGYFSDKIKSLKAQIKKLESKVMELQKDSDELKELKKPFRKEWKLGDGATLYLNLPCGGKDALNSMADIIYSWETGTPEGNARKTREHQLERKRNIQRVKAL